MPDELSDRIFSAAGGQIVGSDNYFVRATPVETRNVWNFILKIDCLDKLHDDAMGRGQNPIFAENDTTASVLLG